MDLIDRSEVLYKFAEILPEADSFEWYEQAKQEEVKDLVDELANLFSKYEIDKMSISVGGELGNCVNFSSHGQELSIGFFTKGNFRRVLSFYGDYEPQKKEENE